MDFLIAIGVCIVGVMNGASAAALSEEGALLVMIVAVAICLFGVSMQRFHYKRLGREYKARWMGAWIGMVAVGAPIFVIGFAKWLPEALLFGVVLTAGGAVVRTLVARNVV